jgi:type VI secretion system secreted protein Hcp
MGASVCISTTVVLRPAIPCGRYDRRVPYFLKIDGIAGESTDAKHKGEIEVESFSWGVAQSATPPGGGGGSGRASFEDLSVVTPFSRASPRLMQACATGEHLRSAVLTGRRSGGKAQFEFMTLVLSDVLVSAYRSGAASADKVVPSDEFSLAYSKLEIEHEAQLPTGAAGESTIAGFDLDRNQKL